MDDLLTRLNSISGSRRLSRRSILRISAGAGLSAALLPVLAACGGDDDDDDDAAPTATTAAGGATATSGSGMSGSVEVTLADFTVKADPAMAAAGEVTFTAKNDGSMEHELVIIKTDTAEGDLPMDGTGSEVDEAAAGEVIGKIAEVEAGKSKDGTFTLTAGKYVLICNVAGHYKAGMHTAFEVM